MGIWDDLNAFGKCNKSILHLTMLTSLVAATASMSPPTSSQDSSSSDIIDQNRQAARIPYCNDHFDRTIGHRLLYVTTLDGRLTALDITKNGKLRWSIPTGPGALISSSIHRLELTNNGQFVRMIPSLSGGIYKFDGESIDPIPITTDHLLSSSAKFSDDLVISGGKETRSYGVSARTGQLLYECSMNGCINATDSDSTKVPDNIVPSNDNDNDEDESDFVMAEHDPLVDDVIVVRRQTQTVRAIESRTGLERWNFSVGQHEVELLKPSGCHEWELSDLDMAVLDVEIKVIVPEGIICAFSKSQNGHMLWKYKFDHPIVSAWKIGSENNLETIDLFGSAAQWLWNSEENVFDMPNPNISPSIYLGMYEKQLYIQESVQLRKEILDQSSLYNQLANVEAPNLPKIPWRPMAASSNSLIIFREERAIETATLPPSNIFAQGNELVPYDEDNFAVSAQSVLNASEYVNGNGFYLYTSEDLNKTNSESLCDDNDKPLSENASDLMNLTSLPTEEDLGFSLDDIDAPVKVVILSLWFWWKEIAVIAFTSAILLNLLMGQRPRTEREIVVIERHIPVPTGIEATEASTNAILGPVTNSSSGNKSNSNGLSNGHRSLSESTTNSGEHFLSRFQSDFDLLRCLGRGGFGVVFEAQNKLDDCKYAIKRITLPNKEESRKRVMREARTLASCEHQNIVRYFHSWVETPPPGWQEQEDSKWLEQEMSTSIQIETPDGTTLPSLGSTLPESPNRRQQNGKFFPSDKKKQMLSWISSMASTACSSDHECGDHAKNLDEEDDDDSCIVFRTESQSLELRELEEEDDDDASSDDEAGEGYKGFKANHNAHSSRSNALSDAISIDIHSNSFDLSLKNRNGKNYDFSHLSDSFQIEFIRSADGDNDQDHDHELSKEEKGLKTKSSSNKTKQKRPSSLDLINFNNNSKDLLLNGTPPSLSASLAPAKPNKVYLYIQMQLCRKESLRDWLRDNKTEARLSHIASIFHQIVDAVDYVHLKGLIHRDLKPSNIFFSQEGQVKIGDFGLVTDMSDIPNLVTKCGDKSGLPSCARHTQQVGTHLYMSPEQLRGQPYDYKVDIYSLGLIFFELHAYFGTEMERIKTLRDLRDGRYPEPFTLEYPAEHKLLQKMLARDPKERPQTKELKLQLNQILKLPEFIGDSEAAALAAAARRLSRSRTFSSSLE